MLRVRSGIRIVLEVSGGSFPCDKILKEQAVISTLIERINLLIFRHKKNSHLGIYEFGRASVLETEKDFSRFPSENQCVEEKQDGKEFYVFVNFC